jgi:hypothetical protein
MNLENELTLMQIFNIIMEHMSTYWVMKCLMDRLLHLLELFFALMSQVLQF